MKHKSAPGLMVIFCLQEASTLECLSSHKHLVWQWMCHAPCPRRTKGEFQWMAVAFGFHRVPCAWVVPSRELLIPGEPTQEDGGCTARPTPGDVTRLILTTWTAFGMEAAGVIQIHRPVRQHSASLKQGCSFPPKSNIESQPWFSLLLTQCWSEL